MLTATIKLRNRASESNGFAQFQVPAHTNHNRIVQDSHPYYDYSDLVSRPANHNKVRGFFCVIINRYRKLLYFVVSLRVFPTRDNSATVN